MFKIGEFSKLIQVPASALRYYDDIGLFKPLHTDSESGYRYYRTSQIPLINRIVALKELGLQLDQIRHILDQQLDEEAFRGMLLLKQAELEQKIKLDEMRLQLVAARLAHIDIESSSPPDNMEIRSLPRADYLCLDATVKNFNEAQSLIERLTICLSQSIAAKNLGRLTAILMQDCYEHEDLELRLGYTVEGVNMKTLPRLADLDLRLAELPPVNLAATLVHIGPPGETFVSRSAIASWVEQSEYEFLGSSREVFLSLPTPGKLTETAIELQYPLRPKAKP